MGYEKAVLIPEGQSKEIKVQFNPAEYNLSRSTSYAEKKVLGMDNPFTQYIAGEAESLKITLMPDWSMRAVLKADVTAETEHFMERMGTLSMRALF